MNCEFCTPPKPKPAILITSSRRPKGCKVKKLNTSQWVKRASKGYWKYISKLPTTTESEKDIYRMGKGWSGGFSVVMLSLHLCEKVDIYGFSGGDVTKSQKGHYYSRPNVRVKQGMRHNYGAELHCLQQIHAAKIERIRVFF
mmetsp:Transcript_17258/g.55317  ORF Transcript_17258/g.55317 Transcript_17258/m.55317 type:complete len:142 (+) Transcript_17258:656-1081(+)